MDYVRTVVGVCRIRGRQLKECNRRWTRKNLRYSTQVRVYLMESTVWCREQTIIRPTSAKSYRSRTPSSSFASGMTGNSNPLIVTSFLWVCYSTAMKWQYIDTHAHLNLGAFTDDVAAVAETCAEQGVAVINVGTKQTTSERAVELAAQYPHCYAIVGLHPIQTVPGMHDEDEIGPGGTPFTSRGEIFDAAFYRQLAAKPKVVGIGECGFDYYHTEPDTYEQQEAAFIAQIQLANELDLPLMIHTRGPKPGEVSPTGRSVYEDVYQTLKQYATVPFNVHFFAGTYAEAKRFFELGGTISFTGVITFASDYEEVVKAAPLERMHAETDCPFVAPAPYRGKRCEPWMVTEVVATIAQLKGIDCDTVAAQLRANAQARYSLTDSET